MDIVIDIIFVCAFYLEPTPERWTTFTLLDREPNWSAGIRGYPEAIRISQKLEEQQALLNKAIERLNKAKDIPPPDELPSYRESSELP
jgi:hypothetical protein